LCVIPHIPEKNSAERDDQKGVDDYPLFPHFYERRVNP